MLRRVQTWHALCHVKITGLFETTWLATIHDGVEVPKCHVRLNENFFSRSVIRIAILTQ